MLSLVFATLRKRFWWPLGFTLLGAVAALYVLTHQQKIYASTGTLLIAANSGGRTRPPAANLQDNRPAAEVDQAYRIKSDPVRNQVIRDLDLMNDYPAGARAQTAVHSMLLRQLKAGVKVSLVPRTDLIAVSYGSTDAQFSASVVNRVMDDFIQSTYQQRFDSVTRAAQVPGAEVARLKTEIQATQTRMIAIEQRLGNTGFNSDFNKAETSLVALIGNAVAARIAHEAAAARFARLSALSASARAAALDAIPELDAGTRAPGVGGGVAGPSEQAQLRDRLAKIQADEASLSVTLGANNPRLLMLRAQEGDVQASLAGIQGRTLASLRARDVATGETERATELELKRALTLTNRNAPDTAEYRELLRQFSLARILYTELYAQVRGASVQAGLSAIQVQVVDPAQAARVPLPTRTTPVAIGLVLLGFLVGAVISFARENTGAGLRTVEDVESVTRLPSLAILPRLGNPPPGMADLSTAMLNLPALREPGSQFAEGLRILRTGLAMSSPGEEPKYILFTSSTPSEGKTTVAGNYALALAESGERVLLIDADMHRPNLHHRFGLSGQQGLSSVLSGAGTVASCVQHLHDRPCLDILAAGPVPPSPAALLAAPAMLRLLREAGPVYRHIVIDSPPVMAVTDGILLAQLVDAVVYVVRFGKVDRRVVRRGRDLLANSGAPLAGVVFNGLRVEDSDEWT